MYEYQKSVDTNYLTLKNTIKKFRRKNDRASAQADYIKNALIG